MPVLLCCTFVQQTPDVTKTTQETNKEEEASTETYKSVWLTPEEENVFTAAGRTNTPNLSSCKKTVWISVFISVNNKLWTRNYTIQCFWNVCVCVCTTWKRSCIFSHPRTSFAQLEHQHKHNNRIINSKSKVVRELLLSPKCCGIFAARRSESSSDSSAVDKT